MSDKQQSDQVSKPDPQPLPIWFFVGLILLAYGLLVILAAVLYPPGTTVLAHTRPGLWWGAIMLVSGALFLGIGLRVHRAGSQGSKS